MYNQGKRFNLVLKFGTPQRGLEAQLNVPICTKCACVLTPVLSIMPPNESVLQLESEAVTAMRCTDWGGMFRLNLFHMSLLVLCGICPPAAGSEGAHCAGLRLSGRKTVETVKTALSLRGGGGRMLQLEGTCAACMHASARVHVYALQRTFLYLCFTNDCFCSVRIIDVTLPLVFPISTPQRSARNATPSMCWQHTRTRLLECGRGARVEKKRQDFRLDHVTPGARGKKC